MTHLTAAITSAPTTTAAYPAEISCCDCLVERISAVWQAFCRLLSECVSWLFSPVPAAPIPAAVYEKAPLAIALKAPVAIHLPKATVRTLRDLVDECHIAWDRMWPKEEDEVPDFSVARPLLNEAAAWKENTPLISLIKRVQTEMRFKHLKAPVRKAYADFAMELTRAYIQAGVTLDDKDKQVWTKHERGGTALHYAIVVAISGDGKLDLSITTCPEFVPLAETLISNGADLEAEDDRGSTPLGSALQAINNWPKECDDGCVNKLIDILLRQGASLGAKISNVDARPLSARALGLEERQEYCWGYDPVITSFINDRFAAICVSTPSLPHPVQKLAASYLEGGAVLDPLPALHVS